jgi:hypothetical protein
MIERKYMFLITLEDGHTYIESVRAACDDAAWSEIIDLLPSDTLNYTLLRATPIGFETRSME